ncbi:MAG: S8 family serine peptidase [Clostridiales bacterium]|nr:S8 family serine peptidase [Clostridiales bacterium]
MKKMGLFFKANGRRTIAWLLALVLVSTLMPMGSVFAQADGGDGDDGHWIASGEQGDVIGGGGEPPRNDGSDEEDDEGGEPSGDGGEADGGDGGETVDDDAGAGDDALVPLSGAGVGGSDDALDHLQGKILLAFEDSAPDFATGSLSAMSKASVAQAFEGYSGEIVSVSELGGGIQSIGVVDLPADMDMEQAIAEYEQSPLVKFAQPIYRYETMEARIPLDEDNFPNMSNYPDEGPALLSPSAARRPNDPILSLTSHHDRINTFDAWELLDVLPDRARTRVAVIDTQIQMNHEDLAGRLLSSLAVNIQFRNNNYSYLPTLNPGDRHGTHVAGLIAANANNNLGDVGVAAGYRNNMVEILPINVFEWNGYSYGGAWSPCTTEGIYYAVRNGAKVINMSLGGPGQDALMRQAVDYAVSQGVVVIAAAGNTGNTVPQYPSDFANAISVINVMNNDSWTTGVWPGPFVDWRIGVNPRNASSSYGNDKNVSGPGTHIWSTVPPGQATINWYPGYDVANGTSMASPVVAGVAALMMYANPSLSPQELASILYSTATDVHTAGYDIHTGHGVVDAEKAVAEVFKSNAPPMPSSVSVSASGLFATTVSWSSVSGVDGYRVYRRLATDSSFPASPLVDRTAAPFTFTDEGVMPGDRYVYGVSTYRNDPGGVTESNRRESLAYTMPAVPAPTGFLAAVGGTSGRAGELRWNAVSGAEGYILYRRDITDSSGTSFSELSQPEGISYTDSSAVWGRVYEYRVAVFDSENSREGEPAFVTLEYLSPAPTGLAATVAGPFSVNVSWPETTGAQYILFRGESGTFSEMYRGSLRTWRDDTAMAGTAYRYAYRTLISGEVSMMSVPVEVATPALVPPEIVSITAQGPTSAVLSWNASTGAAGYEVFRNGVSMETVQGNVTSWTDASLSPTTLYSYVVTATHETPAGRPNETVSSEPRQFTSRPLSPASNLVATANGPSGIRLTWRMPPSSEQSGFDVARVENGVVLESTIRSTTATTLDWNGLDFGPYTFAVRPKWVLADSSTAFAQWITSVSAEPSNPLVTGLRASLLNPYALELSWNPLTFTFGGTSFVPSEYRIWRTDDLASTPVSIGETAGRSFIDRSIVPGRTYSYTVQPRWEDEGELYNGRQSARVSQRVALQSPPRLTGKALSPTSIELTWNGMAHVDGYEIALIGSAEAHSVAASATRYEITGLNPITTYHAMIRPFWHDSDMVPQYGSFSAVAAARTTGPAPAGLKAVPGTLTSTSVELTWNAVSGAEGYQVSRNGIPYGFVSAEAFGDNGNKWADSRLSPGVSVRYTVQACWAEDGTKPGNASSALTVSPTGPAPSGLKIESRHQTSIRVSWKPVADAVGDARLFGYLVYAGTKFEYTTGTAHTVTGLNPNTQYPIRIVPLWVVDGQEEGESLNNREGRPSSAVNARTTGPAPANFRVVPGSLTATSVKLAWNWMESCACDDTACWVYGYRVNKNGVPVAFVNYFEGNQQAGYEWTDDTLRPGVSAKYTVQACWGEGSESVYGEKPGVASAARTAKALNPAPSGLRVVPNSLTRLEVSIRWNHIPGAVEYDVYENGVFLGWIYAPSDSSAFTASAREDSDEDVSSRLALDTVDLPLDEHMLHTASTEASVKITGLTPGSTVRYTVRPVYEGYRVGKASSALSVKVPGGGAPGGMKVMTLKTNPPKASLGPTHIRVQWNSMHGRGAGNTMGKYLLYVNGVPTYYLTGSTYSGREYDVYWFEIPARDPNTAYRIQIAAIYPDGTADGRPGVLSKAVSARTTGPAPGGLKSSSLTSTSVRLEWNAVSGVGVLGYRINRVDSDGTRHTFVTSSRTYTDSTLKPGVNARYTVQACWGSGGTRPGRASAVRSVTPPGAAPGGVKTAVSPTSATVTWNAITGKNANGLTGYKVYLGDEPAAEVSTADSRSVVFANLDPVTRYQVRVAGVYGGREGRSSPVRTLRTAGPAPKSLKAGNTTRASTHLTWNAVTDLSVTGYLITRTRASVRDEIFVTVEEYYNGRGGWLDNTITPGVETRYSVQACWSTHGADKPGLSTSTLRVRPPGMW